MLSRSNEVTLSSNEMALDGRLEDLRAAVIRLQEWVVETISSLGQAVALIRSGDYEGQSFRDWEKQSLAQLRGRG